MSGPQSRGGLSLSAAAIFISAFLLFSLEPLIAKRILPWFGGTAAVWTTCLVFYQVALLIGYLYARLVSRFTHLLQSRVHVGLLTVSLAILPIGPGARWAVPNAEHPTWLILLMLTVTIGPAFVLLSATSPLLQHWLAQRGYKTPYWLFALSNFASLAALIAYPLLIEPRYDITTQRRTWSIVYTAFVAICSLAGWQAGRSFTNGTTVPVTAAAVSIPTRLLWFALSGCGSMLLLSITNHITQNVASVPLLWVVPLAIYLLTYIAAFGRQRLYRRSIWLRVLAMALGLIGYAVYDIQVIEAIQVSLPILLFGLFAGCFFCHAELVALRPELTHLTDFYVMIAAGGAAGAIFVGLLAPQVFSGIYELPLTLVLTAALVIVVTWPARSWLLRLLWAAVTAGMVAVFIANVQAFRHNSLVLERSFYGSLRVVQSPLVTEQQTRSLFHGTIKHGEEFLWPSLRDRPTTYYGPDSGIGILLRDCYPKPKHVGIVGLGVGTLAAYGEAGDSYRFFEINQQVVRIARTLFYFLRQTQAQTSIAMGDGRLLLDREDGPPFTVLTLDAFSGDAIPVHLLTKEAFALYARHLTKDGTIAFHVSNNYLDLASVVDQLAAAAGYQAVLVRNHADPDTSVNAADWLLVTNNQAVLNNPAVKLHARPIAARAGMRPWTDEYNDLLQVLKTPELK